MANIDKNGKTLYRDEEPSFTDIDMDKLDEEWCQQPSRYYRYATQLADAKRKHAEAKAALDVTEAELSLKIRKSPEAFLGDIKPTEASVSACVLTQPAHKSALTTVIATKHDCDVLEAAVWALDHRKKGLENAVQLQVMNYRSAPRPPQDVPRETVERMKDDARRRKIDKARYDREERQERGK